MRVVCISDTHGLHGALQEASPIPPGDVLVHAGDFTDTGARDEVLAFNAWLATLPHKYKIVIAGNHESSFDRAFYPHNWYNYGHEQQFDPNEVRALLTNALYLEDQAVLIDGFLFYGSPWQPEFCNWAFNLPRGEKLVAKWRLIPSNVDVLITHSPPMGRGDQVGHTRVGCSDLLHEVQTRIKPPFHVFGHVHEGYGRSSDGVTTYLNASSCTHEYEAVNAPMVFHLHTPRTEHDPEANHALRYDVLFHEQLRACSQKPVFVPAAQTTKGLDQNQANGRKHSLKEFSVDGTTAAMLFESTLKLRPVKAKQTRALRYLFHHGFTGADGGGDASVEDDEELNGSMEGDAQADVANPSGGTNGPDKRERRRLSLSRRVTMAVLEELPDATRGAIAPTTAELLTASSSLEISTTATDTPAATTSTPQPRRARRDKTLHRREAVAKLATMVEEPEKEAAAEKQGLTTPLVSATESKPSESVTVDASTPVADISEATASTAASLLAPVIAAPGTPAAAPVSASAPAKECIMCKYKVSGHVHPPASSSGGPSPTPADSKSATASTASAVPSKIAVVPSPAPSAPVTHAPVQAISVVSLATPAAPPPVECILCKYKVTGHVHPGAEPPAEEAIEEYEQDDDGEDTTSSTTANRARAVGPKRLSSWF